MREFLLAASATMQRMTELTNRVAPNRVAAADWESADDQERPPKV
jgi:hypothetical protein